ncbi:MAG: hypothetical protein J4G12_06175 [Gemmatimonadetes bacterium]|nr:hypothetical protein [Gemmatimonadota bacterium]
MLFHAHSGLRYLVLLAGLALVLYALWAMATRRPWDRTMRILSATFTASVDLNVLLGAVMLFTRPFYSQLIGHIATMVLAAGLAHVVPMVMRRRPAAERTHLPYAAATVIVLGMFVAGMKAIDRQALPFLGF